MVRNLERGAGILLPISSLPSKYGIGTLGEEAYRFIREIKEAGQKYWQVLPVGPTSFGDSPYQSFSTFAGNPYFIDLDYLIEENLLHKEEVESFCFGTDPEDVSYEALWNSRFAVLEKAFKRFDGTQSAEFLKFVENQSFWLEDYALFMACKGHFNNQSWLTWDEDIRFRTDEGIQKYKQLLKEQVEFWKFIQFKFYEQWDKLKKYANEQDIKIIGDIPIYVALDSSDVWKNPDQFMLDETRHPVNVAGCPPDAFSDEGQKWGNPLYDWKKMEQDDFSWWRSRMKASSRLYDVIRIDHFIGIVRYYVIPADKSARLGWYENGPAEKLTNAINESIGDAKVIAEDLGVLVDGVKELLEKAGYPGMKVLEFAFDGKTDNPYLPHMYPKNCIAYGGTHDNETLVGYYKNLSEELKEFAMDYCDAESFDEIVPKVIRMAYASVADVVMFQMQDILEKDNDARMNLPATIGTNWRWRMKPGEFTEEKQQFLYKLAKIYGRL